MLSDSIAALPAINHNHHHMYGSFDDDDYKNTMYQDYGQCHDGSKRAETIIIETLTTRRNNRNR